MEHITVRVNDGTLARLQRQVERGEYPTQSEALRAYIRDGVKADEAAEDGRPRPMALDTTGDG